MKIEQEKVFKPITITLETADEAVLFFSLIRSSASNAEMLAMENELMSWYDSGECFI